jgi:DNA topoisomerase I
VGLYYATDIGPGISRRGQAGHFHYIDARGKVVRDRAFLARIRKLAIPPAWTHVWISPSANGHIQATGRDARGRKQYRYHADFAAARNAAKFSHLVAFAAALPGLRARLRKDLGRDELCREKVLAAIVSLLETTFIRIGNEDYARTNKSFGLTTLRNRHVKVVGTEIRFLFKGKSGKEWSRSLRDKRVAGIIRRCQELPGQHLFEYRDRSGVIHSVSSSDVNNYLRDITGHDITAKDFRTWAGTVRAAVSFQNHTGPCTKKEVQQVVAAVAETLGNTIAVCRRCYIHPAVLCAAEEGPLALRMPSRRVPGLSREEAAVMAYLR